MVIVLGVLGTVNAATLLSLAAPISLTISVYAIVQAKKILPGKIIPEDMRRVVRPGTVVILVDMYVDGTNDIVVIQEDCEFGAQPDIRKAILPKNASRRLQREQHYRIGANYELFECESHEIQKPTK